MCSMALATILMTGGLATESVLVYVFLIFYPLGDTKAGKH